MDGIGQLNAGLLGRYTIEREIGAGGMATVFLARDLRHDRRVAVKLLKPELGALLGAERFLSEIRVTANLQHPNILPLFDSGETSGQLYYVMPFVEGETLRRRIEREKQLPVEEAVRIAIALCGALDYAHRHGVIHRDLKPENVLLHDGQPMIADFGIALAISNAGGARVTQTGISLGTPQYMSPEQATGDRTIDARTDVYSMGALTYEMLAGEAPHTGVTAQAIIAKLLTEDPRPLSALRRSVPAPVDAAVLRALEKLPADRFATARDFADALSGKVTIVAPREHANVPSSKAWKLATGVLSVLSIAAVAWAATHRAPAPAIPPMRFSLALPDSVALEPSLFARSVDVSPDGANVAYSGANGVFIRALNDLTPRRLTVGAARHVQFSPDGAWVGYVSNGTLRKVPIAGGMPVTIADSVERFGWSSKGMIVFTKTGVATPRLWRVKENGGPVKPLALQPRPGDTGYGAPSFSPDGETFLIPVGTASDSDASDATQIAAYRFSDGATRYLDLRGGQPLYLPGGLLLYVASDPSCRCTNVMAVSLNERKLELSGKPVRVFSSVMSEFSSAELAVSRAGTMVHLPGVARRQVVEIDRLGRERLFRLPPGIYGSGRYSPDNRRVALEIQTGGVSDIHLFDTASATLTRLSNGGHAATPEWTADGKRVAWSRIEGSIGGRVSDLSRMDIHWRAADGSDSESMMVKGLLGPSFSPRGDVALAVGLGRLYIVQLDSMRRSTPIMEMVGGPAAARISPDGRWIAYMASISDRTEVYIRSLSPSGGAVQVSAGGGTEPMWNPLGGELFYRAGTQMVAATLAFGPAPRVVRQDTLPFRIPKPPVSSKWSSYDVSRDGKRFLVTKPAATSDQPIVITGWLDQVRAQLAHR